jgi:tetratricopeptide (TPR) repeat protein
MSRVNLLPWTITVGAVVAAVVGTIRLREPATEAMPETPARLVAAAVADLEKNQSVEALRKLRKVPTSDKLSARARQTEGNSYLQLHFAGKAETHWLEALRQAADVDEAPYRLFDLYFLSGRHAETRRIAVELAPKRSSSEAAAMLLETIRAEHERPAAPVTLQFFEPVLVREPDNGYAMRAVGRSFIELGRVTEGLRLVKAASENLPDDAETFAVLLESLNDTGRDAQAAALFRSASDSLKKHPRALRSAAAALDAVGDANGAEQLLAEAMRLDPFDRKIRTRFASLLERRGATADAKKHENRAKELDDLRERQAMLFQEARAQNNDPGPDLLRRIGANCRDLGWFDVADGFDDLIKRREASSIGSYGR